MPLGNKRTVTATPLIDVRSVSYTYNDDAAPALDNVSLDVVAGHCFGLLGPNGAGKTTLLALLTGLLPLKHGEVLLDGRPLRNGRHRARRLSSLVPQDLAFYPALTGLENLKMFAGLHGCRGKTRRTAVDRAVDICQLGEVLNKQAQSYSGGLKRRLNLAIGLLNAPRLLYLDEPTVGIDAQSRNFILEAIKGLKEQGTTIVYTSHYMEEVQSLCDELAIIDHGRLMVQRSVDALLNEQEKLLELVLPDRPSPAQWEALAELGEPELRERRVRLAVRGDAQPLEEQLRWLRQAGVIPQQVQYGTNRLEDIYLSITRRDLRE